MQACWILKANSLRESAWRMARWVSAELEKIKSEKIAENELQKIKNKTESLLAFEDISLMNRANSLANYELLGDADLMNKELSIYQSVTSDEIFEECHRIFVDNNCSTLYYRAVAL